jgi:hypothetical protein
MYDREDTENPKTSCLMRISLSPTAGNRWIGGVVDWLV